MQNDNIHAKPFEIMRNDCSLPMACTCLTQFAVISAIWEKQEKSTSFYTIWMLSKWLGKNAWRKCIWFLSHNWQRKFWPNMRANERMHGYIKSTNNHKCHWAVFPSLPNKISWQFLTIKTHSIRFISIFLKSSPWLRCQQKVMQA